MARRIECAAALVLAGCASDVRSTQGGVGGGMTGATTTASTSGISGAGGFGSSGGFSNCPPAPPGATTLACADSPVRVVVDGVFVYWVNTAGEIWRVSKTGADPTLLVSTQSGVVDLTVDATELYFGNIGDHLSRAPKLTPAPPFDLEDADVAAIAADDSQLFGALVIQPESATTIPHAIQLYSVPKDGGAPTLLADGLTYGTIATGVRGSISLDATALFWGQSFIQEMPGQKWVEIANVVRAAKDGSASAVIATWPGVGMFGTAKGFEMAGNATNLYALNRSGCAFRIIPKVGGPPTLVNPGDATSTCSALAADGQSVYLSWNGGVGQMPADASSPPVARLPSPVTAVALDHTFLYAAYAQSIIKMPK